MSLRPPADFPVRKIIAARDLVNSLPVAAVSAYVKEKRLLVVTARASMDNPTLPLWQQDAFGLVFWESLYSLYFGERRMREYAIPSIPDYDVVSVFRSDGVFPGDDFRPAAFTPFPF